VRKKKRDKIVGSISKEIPFEGQSAAVITLRFAITLTFFLD